MRSTITAFALLGMLMFGSPAGAQGTSPPSAGATPLPAPVGHRQPRQSDLPPGAAAPNQPSTGTDRDTTGMDILDPDGRLKRALNSICRGC